MALKRLLLVAVFVSACVYVHQNRECLLDHVRAVSPRVAGLFESSSRRPPLPTARLFTADQLRRHSSLENGLYLAVLGKVYDVTSGSRHYGHEGDYHGFTGKDASRAFMTGDFTEAGLLDDVEDLNPWELRSIADWQLFYEKEYTYLGKLVGRFYDASGEPTDYLKNIELKMEEDKSAKESSERLKLVYPPCNVEWTQEMGTRVWCTNVSGGISRKWTGVPRMMYEPGTEAYRCACLKDAEETSSLTSKGAKRFREYEGCDPKSTECHVSKP